MSRRMPMHVVFDARSVVSRRSGIGNYEKSLLEHMVRLSPETRFTVLRNPERSSPIVSGRNVREVVVRGETKSVWTLFATPFLRSVGPYDLYHSPADIVPLGIRRPWIVTIHDLMWEEAPHLASAFLPVRLANGVWYRGNFARSINGAAHIIAISQATADALGRLYPRARSKVSVVHHGIDFEHFSRDDDIPDRHGLSEYVPVSAPYVLLIGQGSPYKNHLGMIWAFLEATKGLPDHKLVLIRRFSRVDAAMGELLASAEVRRKVIVHPFVPQRVLMGLYRHARALLFVSHYEGFGLPAIEAMAMGVPVVGSTASAVEEITADAAIHANPASIEDMAGAIERVLRDDSLRERMVRAGRRRAATFRWNEAAKATLSAYRRALGRTQPRDGLVADV